MNRYEVFFMLYQEAWLSLFSYFIIIHQVDYDNHPLYKHRKTGSKLSPVRLFTNIPPKDVVLPKDEGYRYQQMTMLY